jgi:hypothetical protein
MAFIYRTSGPWGPGQSSNLSPAQVDGNTYEAAQGIAAKSAQGVGIASVALVENNMLQFQLDDHSYLAPVGPLPTAQYRFMGDWQPNTPYLVNDTFSEGGNGYVVLVQHTSAATFDPNANDGSGHDYYGLYFAGTTVVPTGGADGAVLTKHSFADYDVIWVLPTLTGLSDVAPSPAPDSGDLVYWNGTRFSYIDQSSVVGAPPALASLSDVLHSPAATTGEAVYWNGSHFTYGSFLPSSGGTLTGGLVVDGPADLIVQTVTQSGATLSINRTLGENCALSLTASITSVAVTGWPASGVTGKVRLSIANTGAFGITGWPTGTIWPGGTAPTITSGSGKKDIVLLMSDDGGTTIFGSVVGQDYH